MRASTAVGARPPRLQAGGQEDESTADLQQRLSSRWTREDAQEGVVQRSAGIRIPNGATETSHYGERRVPDSLLPAASGWRRLSDRPLVGAARTQRHR